MIGAALALTFLFATAQVESSEATRLTQHGDAQMGSGDAGGAAESYRAAISADPHANAARINLSAALIALGDVDGAIDALESARKSIPETAPLLRNLGRAYLARERWSEAAEILVKAKTLDPANADTPRLLGIALARSGKSSEAIAMLKSTAASRPKDVEVLVELAQAQIDARDAGASDSIARAKKACTTAKLMNEIALLEREQGKTKAALDTFRAAAKLDPFYTPAVGNLGMALVEAGEWNAAKGTLETAGKRDPDPQLRYFLGQARLETGDAKGAIADLEFARQYGYDPRAIAGMLARCYETIGDTKKAEAELAHAGEAAGLAAADESAKKGTELLAKAKYADAAEALTKALEKRPDDGAIWFNLGLARLKMGDNRGALEPLTRALNLVPEHDVVWYALGEAKDHLGDAPGAAGVWTEMLQRFPDRTDVAARLGHRLLELHQDQAAVNRLEDAAKALPNDPFVQYDLAVALTRTHHAERAVEPLTRYLAEHPEDGEAKEALARAQLDAGKPKLAAASYEALSKKEPQVARHAANAAIAWRKAGDAKQEKAWLSRAVALAPGDGDLWNDLGRLQFTDREWAESEKSFIRAAALVPAGDVREAAEKNAAAARLSGEGEKKAGDAAAQNAALKATHLHLGLILVKEKPAIDAAQKRLAKGEDFAKVAKDLSTHPSASNGGDLDWVDPAALPDWAAPAKTLKVGERSGVVAIKGGFAIFQRYRD